jgi:DNA-binding NarL/FixJ family response regulator
MLIGGSHAARARLQKLLGAEADLTVVAEAESVAEAADKLAAVRPDVAVLDLKSPGGDGSPSIEKLTEHDLAPRVLALSTDDEPACARAALAAGAGGYVVATVGESRLLAALRAVRRGQVVIDLDDETKTASVFASLVPRAARGAGRRGVRLSARELQVIRLLGQGRTNQAIAEKLDLSAKTVATYRGRIAEKLGLKTSADFVKYATETGLLGPSGGKPLSTHGASALF